MDMRSELEEIGTAKGTSCNVEKIKQKSLLQVIRKEVSLPASITIEASIALPLFIFFFANVLMLFNIIKMQCDIEAALHQTGNEIALMAFDEKNFIESDYAIGAISVLFAKTKVEKYLGDELKKGIVSDGKVDFLSSKIMFGDDYVDIEAGYNSGT